MTKTKKAESMLNILTVNDYFKNDENRLTTISRDEFIENLIFTKFPDGLKGKHLTISEREDTQGRAYSLYRISVDDAELHIEYSRNTWKVAISSNYELVDDIRGSFNAKRTAMFSSLECQTVGFRPYQFSKRNFSFEVENEFELFKALDIFAFHLKTINEMQEILKKYEDIPQLKATRMQQDLGTKKLQILRRVMLQDRTIGAMAWSEIMSVGADERFVEELWRRTKLVQFKLTKILDFEGNYNLTTNYNKIQVKGRIREHPFRFPIYHMNFEELGLDIYLVKRNNEWLASVDSQKPIKLDLEKTDLRTATPADHFFGYGYPVYLAYGSNRHDYRKFTVIAKGDYSLTDVFTEIAKQIK